MRRQEPKSEAQRETRRPPFPMRRPGRYDPLFSLRECQWKTVFPSMVRKRPTALRVPARIYLRWKHRACEQKAPADDG